MLVFIKKAASLWGVLLLLAIANGGIRDAVLMPVLGQTPALVVSGLILCVGIVAVSWFGVLWMGKCRPHHYWLVGMGWLLATLAFELTFGLLLAGKTWTELLGAYTFNNGNLWPLVLIVILVAPRLCAWLRSVG